MNSNDIDSLLNNAEAKLQRILGNDQLGDTSIASDSLAEESIQFVPNTAIQPVYEPEMFNGSIYDTPNEFELSDDDLESALFADDADESAVSAFLGSIEGNLESGVVTATISSGSGPEVALVAMAEQSPTDMADLDQILNFALVQAEKLKLLQVGDSVEAVIEEPIVSEPSSPQNAISSLLDSALAKLAGGELSPAASIPPIEFTSPTDTSSAVNAIEELPDPEPLTPFNTLQVVANTWNALRNVDVHRLLDVAWQISDDHLAAVIKETESNRPDLLLEVEDVFNEMIEGLSATTNQELMDRIYEVQLGKSIKFESLEVMPAIDLTTGTLAKPSQVDLDADTEERVTASPQIVDVVTKSVEPVAIVESASVDANTPAESEVTKGEVALPEGIMVLSESDTFFSNSGVELSKYPKEFAKPITTATKRTDWFIEQLSNENSENSELLELLHTLKADPVANFPQIFKLGCIKLFGNEFGAPVENRKKSAAELKEEKAAAERAARDAMIEKAKERIKSPEEIQKINAEKSRIGEILAQVQAASTESIDELIGKPVSPNNEPFIDVKMVAKVSGSPEATKEIAQVKQLPQHIQAHFAIIRGGERLALGHGKYLSVEQINEIASKEDAVVIWAATDAALEIAIQKLVNPAPTVNAVSASGISEKQSNNVASKATSTTGTQKIEQKPVQSLSETAHVDKFDAEVEKAIGVIQRDLEMKALTTRATTTNAATQGGADGSGVTAIQSSAASQIQPVKQIPVAAAVRAPIVEPILEQPLAVIAEPLKATNVSASISANAQSKIDRIVAEMVGKNDPNFDCSFYQTKGDVRTVSREVIAISRNLLTSQVKFYSIAQDGTMKADNSLNKVELARMIAQQNLNQIEVAKPSAEADVVTSGDEVVEENVQKPNFSPNM